MKKFKYTYRTGDEIFDEEEEPTVNQRLAHALKNADFGRFFSILKKAVRRTACPGSVNEDYHSTFDMYEKDAQIEHTIPLGNLLLHTAEGRIVGIEIFERANEILGTWEAPENEEDLETRPLGGRFFMNSKEGTYPNQSHAEIVAEDEGCDKCGGEQFEEERRELNEEKELICEVTCQECGYVHSNVKR